MNDGLMVQHGQLTEFGNTLVSTATQLNSALDVLSANVGKIPEAWPDAEGTLTTEIFTEFIEKARPINQKITELGQYATSSADVYVQIESSHAGAMV